MEPFTLPRAEEKPEYVKRMFDRIAEGYDQANDWMTGTRHRAWKQQLVAGLSIKPGDKVLDLATGTGDLARLLSAAVGPEGHVTALDFSPGMLAQARALDPEPGRITWIEGDMQALPFESGRFDAVTVGFGLRNVADLDRAIAEIVRVLKPGGRFGSLEMGRPRLGVVRMGVSVFNAVVVPAIGKMVTGTGEPYRYLHASSEAFLAQDELARRLAAAGLAELSVQDVMFGTLAIVRGHRPVEPSSVD
ncbi:MAG: ubiquinone/menaquinone biosynthesis methyltransferase [Candidatus Sericytochromatia bacterium]